MTSYTTARIEQLTNDPAFQELLAFYAVEEADHQRHMVDKIADMTTDAIEVLAERVVEAPERIPNDELLAIIKTGADRTEAPTQSKMNADAGGGLQLGIQIINQIKEEADRTHVGTVTKITAKDVTPTKTDT